MESDKYLYYCDQGEIWATQYNPKELMGHSRKLDMDKTVMRNNSEWAELSMYFADMIYIGDDLI